MKNYNNLERVGLVLLALGGLFFLSENFYRIDFLNSVYSYGRMLFSVGAAVWAIGYMKRVKSNRDNAKNK